MVVGLIIVDRRFGDVEGDLDVAVEAYRCVVTTEVPTVVTTEVPPEFSASATEGFVAEPLASALAPEFSVSSLLASGSLDARPPI